MCVRLPALCAVLLSSRMCLCLCYHALLHLCLFCSIVGFVCVCCSVLCSVFCLLYLSGCRVVLFLLALFSVSAVRALLHAASSIPVCFDEDLHHLRFILYTTKKWKEQVNSIVHYHPPRACLHAAAAAVADTHAQTHADAHDMMTVAMDIDMTHVSSSSSSSATAVMTDGVQAAAAATIYDDEDDDVDMEGKIFSPVPLEAVDILISRVGVVGVGAMSAYALCCARAFALPLLCFSYLSLFLLC